MLYEEEMTEKIISAAIEVHRILGPGLLESSYERCLCHELNLRKMPYQRQKSLPISYKGFQLDCGYRMDIVVGEKVILEIKAIEAVTEIHKAQLLTYLKLSRLHVGLILNFSARLMKNGIVRLVL
jgi:GxxExxY protein